MYFDYILNFGTTLYSLLLLQQEGLLNRADPKGLAPMLAATPQILQLELIQTDVDGSSVSMSERFRESDFKNDQVVVE